MPAHTPSTIHKATHWILVVALLLSMVLAGLPQSRASAGTPLFVTNLNDSGAGSLRAVIQSAVDGDVVAFAPGLSGVIALKSRIDISRSITIAGPGPGQLTISGRGLNQVFQIGFDAQVTIGGLHITQGFTNLSDSGGAILNHGDLYLTMCILTENLSHSEGGAIYSHPGSQLVIDQCQLGYNEVIGKEGLVGANGGAIWSGGTLEIRDSLIGGNTARLFGGGVYVASTGVALIENVEITGNTVLGVLGGANGVGGGITNFGELTIRNSQITSNNTASILSYGGGIATYQNSQTIIDHTLIQGNVAVGTGGGIDNSGEMQIIDSAIDGNHAVGQFGDGGGIENNGPLSLVRTTISNNTAQNDGGGLDLVVFEASLVNVTISGNQAGRNGGGIFNSEQGLYALHTTISENSASLNGPGVGWGGGVYYESMADEPEEQSASRKPHPTALAAAEEDPLPSYIRLENSILSGNGLSGDEQTPFVPQDCHTDVIEGVAVDITLLANNWIEAPDQAACSLALQEGALLFTGDPQLHPLADNGGPTLTHAPVIGSPVVDAAAGPNCPAEDQRLVARPQDGDGNGSPACDLGSVEGVLGSGGENWAPYANPQHVILAEDTPVEITLTGADPESDPLSYAIVDQPAHGSLVGQNDRYTYSPDGDFFGADSFNFKVIDAHGGESVATVTLEVLPVPDDLMVSLQASASEILSGQAIDYDLVVVNNGPSTAFNVVVEDVLPTGLQFAAGSSLGCSAAGQKVTCVVGALNPGQSAEKKIKTVSSLSFSGTVTNKIQVLPVSADPRPANNTASAVTRVLAGRTVYENDFEKSAGSEWSDPIRSTTPSGANFLGEFNNQNVRLTLTNLGPHTHVEINFDLFLIRSWDGNQIDNSQNPHENLLVAGTIVGPDQWTFGMDNRELLRATFTNWDIINYTQAFPGKLGSTNPARRSAIANNTLGYSFGPFEMDSIYRLTFHQAHSADSLTLDFAALGLQEMIDESWGIDNIKVVVTAGADLRPYKAFLPVSITR